MRTDTLILNEERNVSLICYLHEGVEKRPAVIILPGGYYRTCLVKGAEPVAAAYQNAGYHAFILCYTVGEKMVWPQPLEDYETAIQLIREHAEEWKICMDRIAVCGFSSGGHLASAAATMSAYRPNAVILGYAVLGEIIKLRNTTAPDTTPAVDENMPPVFLFQSRTDKNVPVSYPIRYMAALAEHNVSFESHIYAYGPHGGYTCTVPPSGSSENYCSRMKNWLADSIAWLTEIFGE